MLATIGIVDCIFRRVGLRPSRFHSWAWETAVSLPSEWDGTERKRHRFFYSYCNLTVQHAVQCVGMFYASKSISKEKMFGGCFHPLSVHAAILYREVALRSINTELPELMFNSCNNITLTTSNRQANSMLNNILVRVQMESQVETWVRIPAVTA